MVLENRFVVVHERQFWVCKSRGVQFIYKDLQTSAQHVNNKKRTKPKAQYPIQDKRTYVKKTKLNN